MPLGEIAAAITKEVVQASAETTKEVGKKVGETAGRGIDISKRIEPNAMPREPKKGIDIAKRIIPESSDISSMLKDYVADLKAKSPCSETIKENVLDKANFEKRLPEEVKKMREEFDDKKAQLRNEWEKINGQEWPRYKEDVYNENRVRIRKIGDCFDAHHIQSLVVGGKNEASNLTPLDWNKHKEIHSAGGSCTKVVEKFKEV